MFGGSWPQTPNITKSKINTQLSPQDYSRFREWFEEFESRQWDEQIERDAASGKLDKVLAKLNEVCNA